MARGKSISHYCNHCGRETKMEMIGSAENNPDQTWYRCIRCRHAAHVNLAELRKALEESKRKLERSEAADYSPEGTYTVGQAIFHTEWEDIGKIVSKVRTSDGAHAIVVSFEKLGERRLLESVVPAAEHTH
ncbi:MAG: hypothetical protein WB626_02380 [Bacteroidota bacterium]